MFFIQIKAGSVLNLVGIAMALFSVHVFGGVAFNVFDPCPDWIDSVKCNTLIMTTKMPTFNVTVSDLYLTT